VRRCDQAPLHRPTPRSPPPLAQCRSTNSQFPAQPRARRVPPHPISVMLAAFDRRDLSTLPRIQNECTLFSIFVMRDILPTPLAPCLQRPASPVFRLRSNSSRPARIVAVMPLPAAARAIKNLRSFSSGAAVPASAFSRQAQQRFATRRTRCAWSFPP